jgi:hypothetical protein
VTSNADQLLVPCPRCHAWPMTIHTLSHPTQGTLPTVLICKSCGHKIGGPEIHDEPPVCCRVFYPRNHTIVHQYNPPMPFGSPTALNAAPPMAKLAPPVAGARTIEATAATPLRADEMKSPVAF